MAEKKLNGTVIVTYRCNARCSMCNRYKAPSKAEEEISIETIQKLPKIRTDLKEAGPAAPEVFNGCFQRIVIFTLIHR